MNAEAATLGSPSDPASGRAAPASRTESPRRISPSTRLPRRWRPVSSRPWNQVCYSPVPGSAEHAPMCDPGQSALSNHRGLDNAPPAGDRRLPITTFDAHTRVTKMRAGTLDRRVPATWAKVPRMCQSLWGRRWIYRTSSVSSIASMVPPMVSRHGALKPGSGSMNRCAKASKPAPNSVHS